MKDLPMFTTEHGIASVTLREIPIRGFAYIQLLSSLEPEKLLEDCIGFCRAVGAKAIFASGDNVLDAYPLHATLCRMSAARDMLGQTDAVLLSAQESRLMEFLEIYNKKIAELPNAAWMTLKEGREMIAAGEGYFVHRGDTLLGIGIVSCGELRFLASVRRGAGMDVAKALAHAATDERILLTVALENKKAYALYEKLGFICEGEKMRWYRVF